MLFYIEGADTTTGEKRSMQLTATDERAAAKLAKAKGVAPSKVELVRVPPVSDVRDATARPQPRRKTSPTGIVLALFGFILLFFGFLVVGVVLIVGGCIVEAIDRRDSRY